MSLVSKETRALHQQQARDAQDNAKKSTHPTEKFLKRNSAYDSEEWEKSKEAAPVSEEEEEEEDSDRDSSPDGNAVPAQFRYFLECGGSVVSDSNISWHKSTKNTTTVRAEHQCLDVGGLLWFYLGSFVEYVKDTYNGSLTSEGKGKGKGKLTEQEAHAFVEVLLYPLLCNGLSGTTFHDYLNSDTKPGVYTKGKKEVKMRYSTYQRIQRVVKGKMSFDHLSKIFHLQTMELFDFRGSNFLSLDETMVPFQSSNPDWKDKLRYVPRKPHSYGLLVNNLAGSTTHEKPVCIMLMPQLQGRKPKEIIEEAVEMIKRGQGVGGDGTFPRTVTVVSDSYFGSLDNCEIGHPSVRHIMALRSTNFCSLVNAGLRKGESRTVSIGGRLVSSYEDNKTVTCVSTHHTLKGSKDTLAIGLPRTNQKEVDSAALGSQKAHDYTREELMKMRTAGLKPIAERLYLDSRGTKAELVDRIVACSTSPEAIEARLINFKKLKEKGKPCTCKDYGLFFNNVDNFDKVLSCIEFPWTVEDLMMVYFIFIIKSSIANVYAAYLEVAKDQTSPFTVEMFKVLLLENVFPEYSTNVLGSPPTKKAKCPRSWESRQEIAQASAERRMAKAEEVHAKRMEKLKRKLEERKGKAAYLEKCLSLKGEIADQRAKFKAEEDELMRAIEEQEKENAKLKKDLKA